jgi:hypothetical protein
MWRAAKAGLGKDYLQWRLNHKIQYKEKNEKHRTRKITNKIDSSLKRLESKEIKRVKKQVVSQQNATAIDGVMQHIKVYAASPVLKASEETTRKENAETFRMQRQYAKDDRHAAKIAAELKAEQLSVRHRMEKASVKQERMNTEVRVKSMLKKRAKGKKVRRHPFLPMNALQARILSSRFSGGVPRGGGSGSAAAAAGRFAAAQTAELDQQTRKLRLEVEKSDARDKERQRRRDAVMSMMAASAQREEARAFKLGSLQIKANEKSEKVASITKIQQLNTRLAKLATTNAAREVKAKKAVDVLNAKLKRAKGSYDSARVAAKAAKKSQKKILPKSTKKGKKKPLNPTGKKPQTQKVNKSTTKKP